MSPGGVGEALSGVRRSDLDFFTLLAEIYTHNYTGTVVLHVVNGTPKVAEFPSRQIRLTPSVQLPLDKPTGSR
jgi:hypothetical protein